MVSSKFNRMLVVFVAMSLAVGAAWGTGKYKKYKDVETSDIKRYIDEMKKKRDELSAQKKTKPPISTSALKPLYLATHPGVNKNNAHNNLKDILTAKDNSILTNHLKPFEEELQQRKEEEKEEEEMMRTSSKNLTRLFDQHKLSADDEKKSLLSQPQAMRPRPLLEVTGKKITTDNRLAQENESDFDFDSNVSPQIQAISKKPPLVRRKSMSDKQEMALNNNRLPYKQAAEITEWDQKLYTMINSEIKNFQKDHPKGSQTEETEYYANLLKQKNKLEEFAPKTPREQKPTDEKKQIEIPDHKLGETLRDGTDASSLSRSPSPDSRASSPNLDEINQAEPQKAKRKQILEAPTQKLFKNDAWLFTAKRDEVIRLIDEGADINTQDPKGATLLHWAANGGHTHIIQTLLNAGADMEKANVDGQTALNYAAMAGHTDVVQKLLDAHANIKTVDKDGHTALYWAIFTQNDDIAIKLLDAQEKLLTREDNKNNNNQALLLASTRVAPRFTEALLKKDVDINTKNEQGETALHMAAATGNDDVVTLLISNEKINIKELNLDGATALHNAIKGHHAHVLPILIDGGIDVNTQRNDGATALHIAAHSNDINSVKELLQRNANINTKNKADETAFDLAMKEGSSRVLPILIDRSGIDVNTQRNDGATALHIAAHSNDINSVKELLQRNANINAQNQAGETALHLAANADNGDLVALLIKHGANKKIKNKAGKTAAIGFWKERSKGEKTGIISGGAILATGLVTGITALAGGFSSNSDQQSQAPSTSDQDDDPSNPNSPNYDPDYNPGKN